MNQSSKESGRTLIGLITPNGEQSPGVFLPQFTVGHNYVRGLEDAGAAVILIPLLREEAALQRIYELLDGLLLAGGPDVHPHEYGEEPLDIVTRIDVVRDRVELYIARQALRDEMPILAICRGTQILNVAAGGTLYQDIPTQVVSELQHRGFTPRAPGDYVAHTVDLVSSSSISGLFRSERLGVNSGHHQAVKKVAPGFRAIAHATDGVIEAIEGVGRPFTVGVQWHPEGLLDADPQMRGLFRSFVAAAGQWHKRTAKTIIRGDGE